MSSVAICCRALFRGARLAPGRRGVISIALGLGVPVGLLAGYGGKWTDALISRITDAMLACPFLILAIALAAFLGPSLQNAMIAIGVTAAPIFVRLTRGQVLAVKVEDYVEAARAVGNPPTRIAYKHILPNILPALIVQATISVATAIIAEASLSFLGLGQQPPAPSWGSMLNTAQRFLTNAPWMAIWPGSCHFSDRAVVQYAGRRPARCSGSERALGALSQGRTLLGDGGLPRMRVILDADLCCAAGQHPDGPRGGVDACSHVLLGAGFRDRGCL